jgi:type IV secretion system protein VirB9
MDVETNRRSYAIRLISTRYDYMPIVGFNYPEDAAAQWAAYQQAVGYGGAPDSYRNSCTSGIWVPYLLTGDDPPWRPIGAWTNGRKVCIEMPASVDFGTMPVLEKLGNDGSLFHGPSMSVANYRKDENYLIYDGVFDRAELIEDSGGSRTRVVLTRAGTP